jgi:DNA-binding NarL/FixJ family response regulator
VSKCRVVLVDDHVVFREALAKGLELTGQVEVVGQAGSSAECPQILNETLPDVLVLDLSLPGRGGAEVLDQVLKRFSSVAVLILSSHPPDQFVARLIRQGASGYLHKSCTLDRVVRGILRVHEGRLVIDEDLAEVIARLSTRSTEQLPHETLSSREYQVMERLVSGAKISAIAEEMNLSVKTISTYRRRVLDKLGVGSNSELVSYAIRHSLTVYT